MGLNHCEHTHTRPPTPTPDTAEFATVEPNPKFTFDANGLTEPHGNTVTNPAPGSAPTGGDAPLVA